MVSSRAVRSTGGSLIVLAVFASIGLFLYIALDGDNDEGPLPVSETVLTKTSGESSVAGERAWNNSNRDATKCCCPSQPEQLTKEYFDNMTRNPIGSRNGKHQWKGTEFEEFQNINQWFRSMKMLDECEIQWEDFLVQCMNGFNLRKYLTNAMEQQKHGRQQYTPLRGFGYVQDNPKMPRILSLGDSISRGISVEMQTTYGWNGIANIHLAPTNCGSFEQYNQSLFQWLGQCQWDLIEFNIGMHFHPKDDNDIGDGWELAYEQGLSSVVTKLRQHSPLVKVVFALTTPSPFDSKATIPNKTTCPHYDKFQKRGVVSSLNEIAIRMARKMNVTIIDRYSVVLPELGKYQQPCDIHFTHSGYRLLAMNDWKVITRLLNRGNND